MTRQRLSIDQAVKLYADGGLTETAVRAAQITSSLHPGNIRTYIIERNINYTNICTARCSFCAFSKSPGLGSGYTLNAGQISAKIEELFAIGGRQILLQGGLNPDLGLNWYLELLVELKQRFPELHIHGFSPPEILFLSEKSDMSVVDVIEKLNGAGLDSIPGAGAEILVDRVRGVIAAAKCSSQQWLDVMKTAHRLGMSSTATMMFGHVETVGERIIHLDKLRILQDESLELREKTGVGGVFTAFTCWPFQSANSRLGKFEHYSPNSSLPRGPKQLQLSQAFGQLKMTALSRIYLDNIDNIQASWVTQGPGIGQLSLLMGCNDIGSLMMEENVVAAAGTVHEIKLRQLQELIEAAGFVPVRRDYYYNILWQGMKMSK